MGETVENVVHCKDCKHLYFKDSLAFCPYQIGERPPVGFCDRGEWREPKEKRKMGPKETIDSLLDQAKDKESAIDESDPDCIFRRDVAALRSAVDLLQKAYGDNKPLALNELRQMDGELVWCVWEDGYTQRAAIDAPAERAFDKNLGKWSFKNYGWKWLAYRRKPMEVSNE